MQSWLQNRWTSLWLLFMGLGGLILYLYGFFPLKYHSGKLGHMDDLPNFIDGISIDGQEVYYSGENTVILMVIDGLRYDFVNEEYMPFTSKLLDQKEACIYVAVADPPTVTMPRIKAMMTGSVSTFADVALNFGAPAVRGDSVLRSAAARGRRSVLYGDDTWLRLFPGLWAEYDGTTSFYVTDYTEVDNNVTRHLDTILAPGDNNKSTFDFLVLHYLGLDHIGHLEGARSPKIKPKLLEMDRVVEKIFYAMKEWDHNGILIVCGDHGMRDAGGHGGSTPAEVLVPLVVVRSDDFECPHPSGPGPTVSQVDVAPSIAWLLSCPLPGDSSGRILPALMPADTRQHLYLLHVMASHNTKHANFKNKEFYKQFVRAEKQFAQFLVTGQETAANIAKDFYEEALDGMTAYLAETTVDLDMFAIGIATFLLGVLTVTLICMTLYSFQAELIRRTRPPRSNAGHVLAFLVVLFIILAAMTITCFIAETKSQFCSFHDLWLLAFILTACALTTAYFITKTAMEKMRDLTTLNELNKIDYLLICGTIFHAWSFMGTSFIEEEHMTWYFFWNTLMFLVLVKTLVLLVIYVMKLMADATEVQDKPELRRKMSVGVATVPKWVLLIALHRYLRTMNQTGDRWLFLSDTADWLNTPENASYLHAHILIGTLLTAYICLRNIVKHTNNTLNLQAIFTILATFCILCYRVTTKDLPSPLPEIKTWDQVFIVNIFWGIIIIQIIFEILSYVGIFRMCCTVKVDNKFGYTKLKEKTEDPLQYTGESWNLEDVKLKLAKALSHLMLNNMMLIVILLMRPHNVIMVPSIYITCVLTTKCLDHKMLDARMARNTEVVDILSQTLAHLWIGKVFFFYQGNSNSLASVDLGSGYVGLREYSPVRVGARMGLHAYAGPALAGAVLFCSLPVRAEHWRSYLQSLWRVINIYAAHTMYTVFVYCLITIFFRHHLYVWTVFSPKLLYDFVYTILTIQALLTIGLIVALTHITSWLARTLTYRTRL
ncbi:GPI ethanolamine phosphate transferase 2 [Amyelois transitella]|uniref:GPI ethanolamine phosphate transferase 2 n=1 Tax=Amyelois transitella TaxID=680683 RepID=UPI0029907B34|nr:GPI ethanolamine phosphate transferase 2 [Amyelois transitella]